MKGVALPSIEWAHSRSRQMGAQARLSGCVDESAREGDGRVNEREGECTTIECQGNFRAAHDDSVSSSFVQPPDLGGYGVDGPEGDRCGLCLNAVARVVDSVADPALALLVGFEEAVMATKIDLFYVHLVDATGVGTWRSQQPDGTALRQTFAYRCHRFAHEV